MVGAVTAGTGIINLGFFVRPMGEELGIGNATFGWAQTARLAGFALFGMLAGSHVDTHGARLLLAATGVITALAMVGLASVTAGWQFIALFFVLGLVGMQGMGGGLYVTVAVARWFVQKRGRALSVAQLGLPLGIFVFPPLSQWLIDEVGWRDTWLILGLAAAGVMIVVALAVVRREPQDMGLLPDGAAEPGIVRDTATRPKAHERRWESAEHSWEMGEALRSGAFWRLTVVDGLRMFSLGTLGFYRIPFFEERGLDPHLIAFALSFEAFAAGFGALPMGWAVDRFQPRYVAAFSTFLMLPTFLITAAVSEGWHMFVATSLFGMAAATYGVIQGAMWPSYFGGGHIGSIRGASMPLTLALSAMGPPLTGMIKDVTGSYMAAWGIGAAASELAILLLLLTPRPAPRASLLPSIADPARSM